MKVLVKGLIVSALLPNLSIAAPVTWIEELVEPSGIHVNQSTFAEIAKQLPVSVDVTFANTSRALKLIEHSNVSCRGNLKKSPAREQNFAMTSVPQVVFPGLLLYSHKDLRLPFEISLQDLRDKNLMLGLQQDREYGLAIETLKGGALTITSINASQSSKTAVEMFHRNRFDLLIEYPSVYSQYVPSDASGPLYRYRIQDAEPFSLGYIACSNTEQGRALVMELNRVLESVSKSKAFYDSQAKWFKTEAFSELYNRVYQTDF